MASPVIGGRRSLWGDGSEGTALGPHALAASLATLPKDPTDPNSYSLVPVHAWSHNYSSVVAAARLLQARGGFEVVSPEELVRRLVRRTARRQQCPMPSGSFGQTCLGCSLAGNGSCVLTCDDCETSAQVHVVASCDLAVCAKLSLDDDGRLVCDDSGAVCPGASWRLPLSQSRSRRAVNWEAPHAQHQTPDGIGQSE